MFYSPIFYFFEGVLKIIKIDHEYTCNWAEEMNFLANKGIRYEFVKTNNEGITIWKYKKNSRLFNALAEFYSGIYSR